MTSDQEEPQNPAPSTATGPGQSAEQQAALYGPIGKADYQPGDTLTFRSVETGGQTLTGQVLFVRAPAEAIKGGRIHPTIIVTFVTGEALPRMVYPSDVIAQED